MVLDRVVCPAGKQPRYGSPLIAVDTVGLGDDRILCRGKRAVLHYGAELVAPPETAGFPRTTRDTSTNEGPVAGAVLLYQNLEGGVLLRAPRSLHPITAVGGHDSGPKLEPENLSDKTRRDKTDLGGGDGWWGWVRGTGGIKESEGTLKHLQAFPDVEDWFIQHPAPPSDKLILVLAMPRSSCHSSMNLLSPTPETCLALSPHISQNLDQESNNDEELSVAGIRKCHLSAWRHKGDSVRTTKDQHWGMRQKTNVRLYTELKLIIKEIIHDDELNIESIIEGWTDSTCHGGDETCPKTGKHLQRKQLLQFDKSHRPAFYCAWPKKSHVVGPRHPFRMDPNLDYDVDSDEEWEEDDPGENLSDYNEADEQMLEDCSKVDEEESEDFAFVPDCYLSEDKGVQVDNLDLAEHASSSSQHIDNRALLEVFHQ
ncbi:hypothetical protein MLD38_003644 [Melastoma candidum]|uniref:Uncharacterized protein n=1 Tax=Melastoma candidum TaxID=119954 RepID=A0ACB9S2Y4_9MYRT|nr:hypothetical protein MLD38_003644 [Melastoma candidum]